MRFDRIIGQRVLVLSDDELHGLLRLAARGVVGAVLEGHIERTPQNADCYMRVYEELRLEAEAHGLQRFCSARDVSDHARDYIRSGCVIARTATSLVLEEPCPSKE